jgi:two-component system response regulator PilR (NtrC family)
MAPIAITGESGSGKELAAREIHAQSSRAGKPFIAVNCGAIPEALMEAEFFGYRKGAFTGAADERDGFFQAANGGTLMLDEVADLPLAMQVKLLRAIQERRVRKIGATAEEPVDVRIISATHQDLASASSRQVSPGFVLPPERDRTDAAAAARTARRPGRADRRHPGAPGRDRARRCWAPGVLDTLRAYSFPGNVRELENVLERALAFANDGVIEVGDLSLKGARVAAAPAGARRAPPARPVRHSRPAGPATRCPTACPTT